MKNNVRNSNSNDSYNFFDVEKEFFIIDSDHLDDVRSKFYGYSVQCSGIYEEGNMTEKALSELDGDGAYLWIDVKKGGGVAAKFEFNRILTVVMESTSIKRRADLL